MYTIITSILAFLLGVFITLIIIKRMRHGTLMVMVPDDKSEEPFFYVSLNQPVDQMCGDKIVIFDVKVNPVNTHE